VAILMHRHSVTALGNPYVNQYHWLFRFVGDRIARSGRSSTRPWLGTRSREDRSGDRTVRRGLCGRVGVR